MRGPTRRSAVLATLLGAVPLVAGCGSATYEGRLQLTNERNAYVAKLDRSLQEYWSAPAYQIWLRPPKGLRPMFPPKSAAADAEAPPDPRMEFLGTPLDLPGLIQAWEAVLPAAGGSGPYRLYVLGNHYRFLGGQAGKPSDFLKDFESVLQSLFQVKFPPGNSGRPDANNALFATLIPPTRQFSLPKSYTGANLVPREDAMLPFRGWLFEHTAGQVQVAILMLTPPAPSEDVRRTLMLALETLEVSPQQPRAAPSGRPGPSGPIAPAAPTSPGF